MSGRWKLFLIWWWGCFITPAPQKTRAWEQLTGCCENKSQGVWEGPSHGANQRTVRNTINKPSKHVPSVCPFPHLPPGSVTIVVFNIVPNAFLLLHCSLKTLLSPAARATPITATGSMSLFCPKPSGASLHPRKKPVFSGPQEPPVLPPLH